MTVNDGNGLLDKYGMLNRLKKSLDYVAESRGWARCVAIAEAVKLIEALAEGLKKEDAANEEARKQYKETMERAGHEVKEVPVEKIETKGRGD